MDESLLPDYLGLLHHGGFSAGVLARMLGELGPLSHIRQLPRPRLLEAGFSETQASALLSPNPAPHCLKLVRSDQEWAAAPGHAIVHFESANYPARLREIAAPPPVLYVEGGLHCLSEPAVAIVGSRRGSEYGRRHAEWLAHELSRAGLLICSGMALGIDAAAHAGALAAGANTVAVMGTGVDVCYPARNRRLREQIREQGALVSEFFRGTPAIRSNFPRRNRIISGISAGVIVVEASVKSGSLVTAKLALQQNREVFAMPGPISSPVSRGCHQLIRQGATLVESPEDILQEMHDIIPLDRLPAPHEAALAETSAHAGPRAGAPFRGKASAFGLAGRSGKRSVAGDAFGVAGLSGKRSCTGDACVAPAVDRADAKLLELIEETGSLAETLARQTGLSQQDLVVQMLELEIAGAVTSRAGRYFRAYPDSQ